MNKQSNKFNGELIEKYLIQLFPGGKLFREPVRYRNVFCLNGINVLLESVDHVFLIGTDYTHEIFKADLKTLSDFYNICLAISHKTPGYRVASNLNEIAAYDRRILSEEQIQAASYFNSIVSDEHFYVIDLARRSLAFVFSSCIVIFHENCVSIDINKFAYPLTKGFIEKVREYGLILRLPATQNQKTSKKNVYDLKFSGNIKGNIRINADSEEDAVEQLRKLTKDIFGDNSSFSLGFCVVNEVADEK